MPEACGLVSPPSSAEINSMTKRAATVMPQSGPLRVRTDSTKRTTLRLIQCGVALNAAGAGPEHRYWCT